MTESRISEIQMHFPRLAELLGHKALRLSHAAHARLHAAVGQHLPAALLRRFGQTLFVYGKRRG